MCVGEIGAISDGFGKNDVTFYWIKIQILSLRRSMRRPFFYNWKFFKKATVRRLFLVAVLPRPPKSKTRKKIGVIPDSAWVKPDMVNNSRMDRHKSH